MYLLLNTLWFIWVSKYILFWLYLWQLKDYHIGRFIDHFRTDKGKKIIFDPLQFVKIILFILFLTASSLFNYWFYVLFVLYIGEFVLLLRAILNGSFKKPVKTSKTVLLTVISFLVVTLFLLFVSNLKSSIQPSLFIGFDVLTPIFITVIVLLLQPFFVLIRTSTLKKAGKRMEAIKSASKLKVIAITGSYGKTSTKEFLSVILSNKFKVLETKEHQNSEIGIARCILEDLKSSHQIFIAEVGAYNKGKVKEVCSIIKPEIGIVTGVNEQHLALFGSLDNLLSAEGGRELVDALPKNGTLVINGDNKYCLDLYKRSFDVRLRSRKIYSLSNNVINSDIWSDSITVYRNYISFIVTDKTGEMMHFNVKVLGKHNVQNLLGAILIAKELGMNFGEISKACENISQEQGGMTLRCGKHDIDIIDSSYSANPDGVFADLDYFSFFEGKKVIVMPCLIELGEKSSEIHKKLGRKISDVCDLAIITSKDKFKELKEGALESGMLEKNILLCDNPDDIHSIITLFCKSGDAVLLEGRVPNRLITMLKL